MTARSGNRIIAVSRPHERIQSTATEGFVALNGSVPQWYQREDAERAVRDLAGARGVVNLISAVHAWAEKWACAGAAGHAPGVRAVRGNLRIQPFG